MTIGTCKECGGNCSPECGKHPAGCTYGGSSYGYWLKHPDCELVHIEPAPGGYYADKPLTEAEREFYAERRRSGAL